MHKTNKNKKKKTQSKYHKILKMKITVVLITIYIVVRKVQWIPFFNHHHHLPLNCEGRWGTTTSFLHFSPFSTALWDLANPRPVLSLMLFLSRPCQKSNKSDLKSWVVLVQGFTSMEMCRSPFVAPSLSLSAPSCPLFHCAPVPI